MTNKQKDFVLRRNMVRTITKPILCQEIKTLKSILKQVILSPLRLITYCIGISMQRKSGWKVHIKIDLKALKGSIDLECFRAHQIPIETSHIASQGKIFSVQEV